MIAHLSSLKARTWAAILLVILALGAFAGPSRLTASTSTQTSANHLAYGTLPFRATVDPNAVGYANAAAAASAESAPATAQRAQAEAVAAAVCTPGWLGPYGELNHFLNADCTVSVQSVVLPSAETTGAGATSFSISDGSCMDAGLEVASGFTLSLPDSATLTDTNCGVPGSNGSDLSVDAGGTFKVGAGATIKLGTGANGPDVVWVAGALKYPGVPPRGSG